MRNKGKTVVGYKRPVSLKQVDKYKNPQVIANLYKQDGQSYSHDADFCNKEFSFNDITMKTLCSEGIGQFVLPSDEKLKLAEFMSNVNRKKIIKRNNSSSGGIKQPSAVSRERRIVLFQRPQPSVQQENVRRSVRE